MHDVEVGDLTGRSRTNSIDLLGEVERKVGKETTASCGIDGQLSAFQPAIVLRIENYLGLRSHQVPH